jgi:membrane-associated phospholipid phosphatase
VSTQARVIPADRIHAVYNLLLAALWATCLSRSHLAAPSALLHLTAACLPVLLRHGPERLTPPVAVLREYYPLLWIESYWIELAVLIPLLHCGTHDAVILRFEAAVGLGSWNIDVATGARNWTTNEAMYFLYFSYLPLLIVTPIALGIARRLDIVRDFAFRVSLVALVCFSIYLAWPVAGPAYTLPGPRLITGPFSRGMQALRSWGDAEGTAFPSLHVAIATTIALVGLRWLPRRIAFVLAALAVGIAIACLYTNNHYLVDVVTGATLAILLHAPAVHRPQRQASESAAGQVF